MIDKRSLKHGEYYYGSTSQANNRTARWDGNIGLFFYMNDAMLLMDMNHVEDGGGRDFFEPKEIVTWGTDEIRLPKNCSSE